MLNEITKTSPSAMHTFEKKLKKNVFSDVRPLKKDIETSKFNVNLNETTVGAFLIKDVIKAISMGAASPLRSLGRIDPETIRHCVGNAKKDGLRAFKPLSIHCIGKAFPTAKMVGTEQFLNHMFTYMSGSKVLGAASSALVGASLDIFTRHTLTDVKTLPHKYMAYTSLGLTARNYISIQNIQLDDPILSSVGNGISRIFDSATITFIRPEGIKINSITMKSFCKHLPANALFTMGYTFVGQKINKALSSSLNK